MNGETIINHADQWPEKDLFGDEIALDDKVTQSPLKGRRLDSGYPAKPGTGPANETCGSCDLRIRFKVAGAWYKCQLMQPHWSHSAGTDIKLKSPACSCWEKPKDKRNERGGT